MFSTLQWLLNSSLCITLSAFRRLLDGRQYYPGIVLPCLIDKKDDTCFSPKNKHPQELASNQNLFSESEMFRDVRTALIDLRSNAQDDSTFRYRAFSNLTRGKIIILDITRERLEKD